MHVHVEGLEDHVRQVVKEEVAVHEDDPWLTSDDDLHPIKGGENRRYQFSLR